MIREPPAASPAGPDDADPVETLASDEPAPYHSAFESLLRRVARAPALSEVDAAPSVVELPPGVVVGGRFEVLEEIGRGGFAKVYRARDRVLTREVAIKLLARRRRLNDRDLELFYREAQATARLNHVHIVTAYDWGEWNGVPFLVLELLEGEPLSAVLARGPVPEARAWSIARDVARAVVYAHSQGVLHLDLKSQNVFVLRDGRVKVLDFGLAGLEWESALPGSIARVAGGTPATMAPEQAEGSATDARTDIWAIGVILHELLIGRLPDKIPAGARAAPLPPGLSRRAEAVLRQTLAVDPAARFPDSATLLAALEEGQRPPARRLTWSLAAAGLVAGGLVTFAALATRPDRSSESPAPGPVMPPSPDRHTQLTFTGDVEDAEISPRGDALAYLTHQGRELWVRELDADQPRRIFAGDKLDAPRWFPDGQRILVRNLRSRPPTALIVPASGGAAREIASPRELIVPATDETLVSAERGYLGKPDIRIAPLAGGDGITLELPNNFKLVFDIDAAPDGRILLNTFDRVGQLWSVRPGSPAQALHSESEIWGARWDAQGRGVFFRGGRGRDTALRWLPVPPSGAPPTTLFTSADLGEQVSVSRDGRRLLYQRVVSFTNLVRLARDGEITPLITGTAELRPPRPSRDGSALVYALREDRRYSLVVRGLDGRASRTRSIRCAGPCGSPVWSPDGRRIAFIREERERWVISIIASDGSDLRDFPRSRPSNNAVGALDWLSPNDIVYTSENNGPLRVLDLQSGEDRALLAEPATGWMFNGRASPDGRRVAFYWHRGDNPTSGIYLADRSGDDPRLLVGGPRLPIGWTPRGDELLVEVHEPHRDPPPVVALERIDVRRGASTTLWKAPAELEILSAVAIPGTDDFLLREHSARTDAWLIEDPLGRATR